MSESAFGIIHKSFPPAAAAKQVKAGKKLVATPRQAQQLKMRTLEQRRKAK